MNFTPTQQKAFDIEAGFRAEVAAIRANHTLSDEGKVEALRDADTRTRAALEGLRTLDARTQDTRRAALQKKLLTRSPLEGTDATLAISYRDAAERAGRIDTEEAATDMMLQAVDSRDVPLERALLSKAYKERWADVVNTYSANHTYTEADVDELWALTSQDLERTVIERTLQDSIAFAHETPREITSTFASAR